MTPKYADRPDLPMQIVKTVTGMKEYRKNCRRKDGLWFAIDVDVVQVEGKWYTTDSNTIVFDHETKEWNLSTKVAYHNYKGVVGYNKETNELILGYFTHNPYNNCIVSTGSELLHCLDSKILEGSGYTEDVGLAVWTKNASKKLTSGNGHADKGYNIEENGYEQLIKLYAEKPYKVNLQHAKIASLLGNTTFGIELEACLGNAPQHLLNRVGCTVCKDGSLRDGRDIYPPEYVTVPLHGAKGISNTVELSDCLKHRNEANLKCAYHLHLGGFNTSRQFIVALHSLCFKIQGDIFRMFPHYKLKPEGIKEKNYCKPLPKVFTQFKSDKNYTEYINSSYIKLYKYCSEYSDGNGLQRVTPDKNYNRKNKVHHGKAKWNKLARYHWLNMVNIFFSERNTVEFRVHTPTFNATKIVNWLLICNAICKYAERYPLDCVNSTKISLDDVLGYYQRANSASEYSQFISNYLKAYVNERTILFRKDKKAKDFISEHELKADKTYTFEFEGKTLL